jgi:hypothetical protein
MSLEHAWQIHRSLRLRRDVLPHVALEKLADACLSSASAATGHTQTYWCLGTITFSALAVESFLNLVGSTRVPRWDEIERTASPAGKLAVLEAVLGFQADRARASFNQFNGLFKFRNAAVHAKPEFLPVIFAEDHSGPIPASSAKTPVASWERSATLPNARRQRSAASAIIAFLANQANIQLSSDDHSVLKAWLEDPSNLAT